jgi:hypothetical protein
VTNPRSRYSSAADLEKLQHIYRFCKHKSCYPDGRPRPCRSPRCPCEACRRKHAEKEAAIFGIKELVKGWWAMSCSDRQTAVYCDRVRNVPGLANYVTKNVKDRRKVEMPPQEWNGRRCRLVWRSRGFLTKNKDRLWQEQRAEWYPQPVVGVALHGEGNTPEIKHGVKNRPTSPVAAPWPSPGLIGPWRRLRLVGAAPGAFGRVVQPLDGIRGVQTARGP